MHEKTSVTRSATARERIDQSPYELFSRHGVRAVGVDEIVARSGVAKMTLYRHYASKVQLALAFLRRREELWTRSWLQAEVEKRAGGPCDRLLAIFDVFDNGFGGAISRAAPSSTSFSRLPTGLTHCITRASFIWPTFVPSSGN